VTFAYNLRPAAWLEVFAVRGRRQPAFLLSSTFFYTVAEFSRSSRRDQRWAQPGERSAWKKLQWNQCTLRSIG